MFLCNRLGGNIADASMQCFKGTARTQGTTIGTGRYSNDGCYYTHMSALIIVGW